MKHTLSQFFIEFLMLHKNVILVGTIQDLESLFSVLNGEINIILFIYINVRENFCKNENIALVG